MISKENCGFVVPPDDAVLFADALVQAADDRDELQAKGVRGRELAVREFDRRQLADRFVDWLEGVAR